ncbi:MAG: response regulator transcription factor [Oscillospiraceae bacterium]|jgi:two-component system response regulator YesN
MSYSVIILDDEPLIVSGISKSIPWEAENCRLIASSGDGLKGKELIDKYKPDILISDIIMPGCSGLELAEHCRKNHYKTKIIILSAYSDFHYAQQAITYKVSEYIIKPIDFDKLLQSLRTVVQELDAEQKDRAKAESVHVSHLTQPSVQMLFDIARHGDKALEQPGGGKRSISIRPGVVISAQFYNINFETGDNILPLMQSPFITSLSDAGYSLVRGSSDHQLLFLCDLTRGIDYETSRQRIIKQVGQVARTLCQSEEMVCVVAVSSVFKDHQSLHKAYKENQTMIAESYFEKRPTVLTSIHKQTEAKDDAALTINNIVYQLSNSNESKLLQDYQWLCDHLERQRNREHAKHAFRELYWQATNLASQAGMIKKPDLKQEKMNENFFADQKKVLSYLLDICSFLSSGENIIGRLRILIENNYHDPDFGLAQAAESLQLSGSYLSRLFKEKMSKNFTDYLMELRLERAQELLLHTDLKIETIANKVGFVNHNYFGQVFKRFTGLTPRQYRQQSSQ